MIRRLALAVALVPLLLAACDWAQPGFGPGRAGYNPGEARLGPGNVAQLTEAWSASLPTDMTARQGPVVAGGRVFVTAESEFGGPSALVAFDADDGSQLWSRSIPGIPDLPTVAPRLRITTAGDVVLLGSLFSAGFGGLEALDATTGEPLWSTQEAVATSDPIVYRGVVYAWYVSAVTYFGGLAAFDLETGEVLWRSPDVASHASFASVQGGRVYATVGDELQVYDAAGVENCAGEPTTCRPVWTAALPSESGLPPVLAAGSAFVSVSREVLAFPAGGCGASTCQPAWSVPTAFWPATLAVAKGTLFASGGGVLSAFPAGGCGAPTCGAQWAATGATGAPAVANGVVYATGEGHLHAYAAAGCGASTCSPLWSSGPGVTGDQQPAITGGRVYTAGTSVEAFALPGGVDAYHRRA